MSNLTDFILNNPLEAFQVFLFVFIFFGFCIFIHELGHFLAAKWRGLHIIAFSIGFKKIWGFKHNGIEYRIGCIPCGGYVDLPQIDATGEPKDENGNPLPRAKPIDKIITALAGPLFNILFGIALGCVVWHYGILQDTPKMQEIRVENIDKYSPEYKAGLRKDDIITELNGEQLNCTWNGFVRKIFFSVGKVKLTVKRGDKILHIAYKPKPNEKRTPREKIAYPFFTPSIPLECSVVPGSPADKGGLKTGDIIIKINEKQVIGFNEFNEILRFNRGEPITFTVKRNGKTVEVKNVRPKVFDTGYPQIGVILTGVLIAEIVSVSDENVSLRVFKPGDIILKVNGIQIDNPNRLSALIEQADGKPLRFTIKRDGKIRYVTASFPVNPEQLNKAGTIHFGSLAVNYTYDKKRIWAASVLKGTPAKKAGMHDYDIILEVNGEKVTSAAKFIASIRNSGGKKVDIKVERDGKPLSLAIIPEKSYAVSLGIRMIWIAHPTPWKQFVQVIDMTYKSLRGMFYHMTTGGSTLKPSHLSGPVGIFRVIAVTFERSGWKQALFIVVMITYSLAILNIMPLPVLDGGHIVLALIEWIRGGKPLSARIVQPVFMTFIILLMSMMVYVTYFDFWRMTSVKKEYRFLPVTEQSDIPANGGTVTPDTAN